MAFARTLHLLSSERARGNAIALVLVVVLLGVWGIWLGTGRITVQTVARSARFEAEDPPLAIQSAIDGEVEFADLRLGREVKQGDILIKLNTSKLEFKKTDQKIRMEGMDASLTVLKEQLAIEERARDAAMALANQSMAAGQAKARVAAMASESEGKQAEMIKAQAAAKVASKLEEIQSQGKVAVSQATVQAALQQAMLDGTAGKNAAMAHEIAVEALKLTFARTKTERDVLKNDLAITDFEIEKCFIRATIGGTLAEISPLAAGQRIPAGSRLATVVPPTKLRVVASFSPQEAVGRVRPGQHVVLRVDNYPWAQYGTVDAVVDQVANEPRDGMIRAEMHVAKENPQIPLMHGLTTQAEVDVERVSPLGLLLRMAGQTSAPPPSPGPPPNAGPAQGTIPAR